MRVITPDYRGGSIANLMASICAAFGGEATGYPPLRDGPGERLQQARNILLLVIDGLGERWLRRHGPDSALAAGLQGRLTSVCPSTTASAIPTFLTGVAPQQHGFTGWFTWFAELGSQLTVLPFQTRLGALPVPPELLSPADLSGAGPFPDRLPVQSHLLMPEWLAGSRFNQAFAGRSAITGYRGLAGLAEQIQRILLRPGGRRYLYAYWPEFDAMAHQYGVGSPRVQAHFQELDQFFAGLQKGLEGSGTALLVTADHGFVDTRPETRLQLEAHPRLAQMLRMPLCGEPRLAFCYVEPGRQQAFERYVADHLSHAMQLYPGRLLLEQGWFGVGPPHPRLHQRIGDYALVMKGDYCLTGRIPGERPLQHVGVHGGMSADEMFVPLIHAQA